MDSYKLAREQFLQCALVLFHINQSFERNKYFFSIYNCADASVSSIVQNPIAPTFPNRFKYDSNVATLSFRSALENRNNTFISVKVELATPANIANRIHHFHHKPCIFSICVLMYFSSCVGNSETIIERCAMCDV